MHVAFSFKMSHFQWQSMGLYCIGIFLCLASPVACLTFTKGPNKPVVVYIGQNSTGVEMRWEWNIGGGGVVFHSLKVSRYQENKAFRTEKDLIWYFVGEPKSKENLHFKLEATDIASGYAKFTIKDILNQGNNKDSSKVDVMEAVVYVYTLHVTLKNANPPTTSSSVKLNVYKIPVITTYPQNQTASGGTVMFECVANGKPTPNITWEKIGSSQSFDQGSPLTIDNFDASKIGVYKCTAKSPGIPKNATGIGYVQFRTCASGCSKEELGIEMTDLSFTSEYENPNKETYKELKRDIEAACLAVYANRGKAILKCEVLRFRKGSVVAVIELGWPTGTSDPKEPLRTAIQDGNFAGQKVKTGFVSPTSPTTERPITTTTDRPITNNFEKKSKEECTCSSIIAVCVTVILLLVVSNIVLAFFFWRISLKLKGRQGLEHHSKNQLTGNEAEEQTVPRIANQQMHGMRQFVPDILPSDAESRKQPPPVYQELTYFNHGPSIQLGEPYQALDNVTRKVNNENPSGASVAPHTYQAL